VRTDNACLVLVCRSAGRWCHSAFGSTGTWLIQLRLSPNQDHYELRVGWTERSSVRTRSRLSRFPTSRHNRGADCDASPTQGGTLSICSHSLATAPPVSCTTINIWTLSPMDDQRRMNRSFTAKPKVDEPIVHRTIKGG